MNSRGVKLAAHLDAQRRLGILLGYLEKRGATSRGEIVDDLAARLGGNRRAHITLDYAVRHRRVERVDERYRAVPAQAEGRAA